MGRTPSTTPDLFSTLPARDTVSSSVSAPPSNPSTPAAATTVPSLPYVLPKDLPKAIKQTPDEELDRLSAAVLAEQKRRGKKPPDEGSRKRRGEEIASHLTVGKLNAVRAAFKAGVDRPTVRGVSR
jgi:hypothetical protein